MRRSAALLGALAGLLAGCAGSLPVTHYYTLGPPPEPPSGSPAAEGLAIGVESFAVDPPYDQDRLVYRRGGASSEVGFYHYHRWAAPLGRLVAVAVADGLRGAPGVAAIEPALGERPEARLGGRVLYFEEIVGEGGREARVAVAFELEGPAGAPLWEATLSAAAAAPPGGHEEPAALLRRAFDDLLAAARAGLATALEGGAPPARHPGES